MTMEVRNVKDEAKEETLDIINKYRKIQEIVTDFKDYQKGNKCGFGSMVYMQMVSKVIEDEEEIKMNDVDELIRIYKRSEGIAGDTVKALEHLKEYETSPTFTAEDVLLILIEHGQHDSRFKLGEIIKYSPTDIYHILSENLKLKQKVRNQNETK